MTGVIHQFVCVLFLYFFPRYSYYYPHTLRYSVSPVFIFKSYFYSFSYTLFFNGKEALFFNAYPSGQHITKPHSLKGLVVASHMISGVINMKIIQSMQTNKAENAVLKSYKVITNFTNVYIEDLFQIF